MTPRNRIAWLDTQAGLERNLEIMAEHEFSRYPVYRDNDMDVVGVLELKSLATRMARGDNALFQTLREPLYVSESTHAMKLLEIFREEQQSMALVVDEYGEIQGLVTISDLMGAVVGRLQAVENADEDALVVTREDGSLLVDGSLPIDLRELIGSNELPDAEDGDYYTLAGMCIHYFGRIPHAGEYFDWAGWRFEVVDLDGARVDSCRCARCPTSRPMSSPPEAGSRRRAPGLPQRGHPHPAGDVCLRRPGRAHAAGPDSREPAAERVRRVPVRGDPAVLHPDPGMGGAVSGPLVILIGLQMLFCLRRPWLPGFTPDAGPSAAPCTVSWTASTGRCGAWTGCCRLPAAAADALPAHAFSGLLLLGLLLSLPIPSPTSCSASSCCCFRWRCWNAMAR